MYYTQKDLEAMEEKDGFRQRGKEMTRLETFIDAAFGFAITMLVVSSGEIPGNYPELILALKEIPSFIASFFVIMLFWIDHRNWSRRYGLEDRISIYISLLFVFVLLVYVYPLRLVFSVLFHWLTGGWLPAHFSINSVREFGGLFIIYGIGVATIAGLIALLYVRAKSARIRLKLNKIEIIKTDADIANYILLAGTGIVSALFAWLIPPNINLMAGFVYLILPIAIPLMSNHYKKKIKKMQISENRTK